MVQLVFRMDDLDPSRCTGEYAIACLDDIKGMGLDWDEGPDIGGHYGPYEQSKRSRLYLDTLSENCTSLDVSIHAINHALI